MHLWFSPCEVTGCDQQESVWYRNMRASAMSLCYVVKKGEVQTNLPHVAFLSSGILV